MLYSPSGTSGGGGPNTDVNQIQKFAIEKKHGLLGGFGHSSFNGPMTKQFFPISMTMEISPIHHSVVLGKVSRALALNKILTGGKNYLYHCSLMHDRKIRFKYFTCREMSP